jgi:hypothetical protein
MIEIGRGISVKGIIRKYEDKLNVLIENDGVISIVIAIVTQLD